MAIIETVGEKSGEKMEKPLPLKRREGLFKTPTAKHRNLRWFYWESMRYAPQIAVSRTANRPHSTANF
jgi:hypothetical protein